MATLDTEALRNACHEVAKATLWQTPEPYDIRDIIDSDQIARTVLAYTEKATERANGFSEDDLDPNIVTRAVVYLAHEHAIPPMKDGVRWFENTLDVLLRLVTPISPPTREAAFFMDDLEEGVRRYKQEADASSTSPQ